MARAFLIFLLMLLSLSVSLFSNTFVLNLYTIQFRHVRSALIKATDTAYTVIAIVQRL